MRMTDVGRRKSASILAGILLIACGRSADIRQPSSDIRHPSDSARADPIITDSQAIFLAHGLESGPAWRVEIYGEGIRYRGPESAGGVVFPAGRVDGDDSASVWSSKRYGDEGPHSIHLEFLRRQCSDGATSTAWPYSVALVVDDAARQGCASKGPGAPATPAPPAARGQRPPR
jgi:uncharacterized membrane protein